MATSWLILVGVLVWGAFKLIKIGRREKYLPPGPPTIPLLGNLHVFPNIQGIHFKFSDLAHQYGEIFSLKASSQSMIVLSSATAVREVVDKTGWLASSRPESYIPNLLSGHQYLLFAPDAPELRVIRRAVATYLSKQNAQHKTPIVPESAQLLYEILENPKDFKTSVRRFTYSTVKALVYGQRVPLFDSEEVLYYFKVLDELVYVSTPGTYPPIDLIPILKYLPGPLAPWYRRCLKINEERAALHTKWYREAKRRAETSDHLDENERSFVDWVLRESLDVDENFISITGLALMDGGSDTCSSILLTLILALASNPECQQRAFEEVRSAVGARMPEIFDMDQVPFVAALIKEIVRLRPPVSLGLPHAASADIHYGGYLIPKGATVIINIYGILNDPEVFEQPHVFNPERFMQSEFGTLPGKDENFRDSFAFGGGRRICPGQWLANHTLTMAAMRLIWAFEFSNAVNVKTRETIPPGLKAESFNFELIVMPHPFECTINPRADRAQSIRDNFVAALGELEKFEVDFSDSDAERMSDLRSRVL